MGIVNYMNVYWIGYIKGTFVRMYGVCNVVPSYVTVVSVGHSYRSAKLWKQGIRS